MPQDRSLSAASWVHERRTAAAASRAEHAAEAAERAAAAAEATAAASLRRPAVTEPRPYYRRVQQHLQAG